MIPRALVVRSGANPFLSLTGSSLIEIVERVSHSIESVEPDLRELEAAADLAIFTSQVAVEIVLRDSRLEPLFRKALAGGRVAAVGGATEDALTARGVAVDLVGAGSADGLLERLPRSLERLRILLPCGEDASPDLSQGLRSRGAQVSRLVVYRKVPHPRDTDLERKIEEGAFAAFCTTSPSAAQWLFAGLSQKAAERLRSTPAVVLGRFTRRFLEGHGVSRIEVTEEARFSEAVGLLESLAMSAAGT